VDPSGSSPPCSLRRTCSAPAAANLARAGFVPRATRTVWRPPQHLLGGEDGEDEDERDDDWRDGDDFDAAHDFRLEE
jgi:hypothetical protein